MRPMTDELRARVRNYIKSGVDISELIKDVEIKNEDLSYAVISSFDRSNQDISNCKLTAAKISKANLLKTNVQNVTFNYADISYANCRFMDARGASFYYTNAAYAFCCHADFRGCYFCGATFTLSSKYFYKAKMSPNIFELLSNIWDIVQDDTKSSCIEKE